MPKSFAFGERETYKELMPGTERTLSSLKSLASLLQTSQRCRYLCAVRLGNQP